VRRAGRHGSVALTPLNTEYGRKYRLGGVVASGGMGAIIDARDVNIRRSVAMKVLLDPKQARHEDVLRFVEEDQLTGQLEHPGIVPVHELGVDTAGNVFYTMKFVRGRTLADVLANVAGNEAGAAAAYPLNRLLNVFFRVCEAMAFAHSRGVLHRDLSPLRGLSLESLAFAVTKPPPAGIDALRGMASLLTINGVTAAEFWRRYETGEIPTLKAAATNAAADAAADAFPTNLPTGGPGAAAGAGL
jgi:hypothetical protein